MAAVQCVEAMAAVLASLDDNENVCAARPFEALLHAF